MKKIFKSVVILILAAAFFAFYKLGLYEYLNLEQAKNSLLTLQNYNQLYPIESAVAFVSVYIVMTAMSFPGAVLLTLLSGAIFGAVTGTILVSFSSTIGASIAFLLSRYLFSELIQKKFSKQLNLINEGLKESDLSYLLTLRLIPVFPFFLVNILMGLTKIKTSRFFWISQLGMLPGTFVYVQAGSEISKIQKLSDVTKPSVLITLSLLGLLPWLIKAVLNYYKNKKVYKSFKKPNSFDYNVVVIGAGAAGLVSSYISAAVKAKVALIESHKMGGDCLNYGCVPSKALIKSASLKNKIEKSESYGLHVENIKVDFLKLMNRIQDVIKSVEPHDSVQRYTQLGVDCYQGRAEVLSPFEVKVNGKILSTKNIIIASGAEPVVPRVEGIEQISYLTSENIWSLKALPEKLLVVGGGAIGCELAQSFRRLGSKVMLIEKSDRLLSRGEEKASELIKNQFLQEGVEVYLNSELKKFEGSLAAHIFRDNQNIKLEFSHVLFALGRKARSVNSGFEVLGLELNDNKTVKHNTFMQTKYPNVYVCGDVAGPIQLTHMAAHQAWYASVNALFAPFKKFKADYSYIPSVVFTDPEVAQVGLSRIEAEQKNIEFDVTHYDLDDLDRAICESETQGFVQILTRKGTDKIIGATIVGSRAGELIAEITLAMRWGLGLNKILSTVHSYPTWSEALKMTAGKWRQNHKPMWALKILDKYFQFRRGN